MVQRFLLACLALACIPASASAQTPDTTPPHTTITQYPGVGHPATLAFEKRWPGIPFRIVTWPDDAVIAFEADEPARFECHAWDQPWSPCTSPVTLPTIDIGIGGEHLFVRAIDTSGNAEETPAHVMWSINPPDEPLVPPTITGTFKVGQQLSCDGGQWNSPLLVPQIKQWHRDGTSSSPVVATGDTYTVAPADVGHQMYCDFNLFTSPAGWWFHGYTPRIPAKPVKLPAALPCPATEPATASDATTDARLDGACRLSVTSDQSEFHLDSDGDADTGDPAHDGADRFVRLASGAAILAYWSPADGEFLEAAVLESEDAEDGRTTWTGTTTELGLVPGTTLTLRGGDGSVVSLPVTLAPEEPADDEDPSPTPTPTPTPTATPIPTPPPAPNHNARIARLMPSPPTLTGNARVGSRLTCKAPAWTAGSTVAYTWKRDGRRIKGETSRGYTVRRTDRRHRVTCAVTGKLNGVTRTVATSPVRIKR